jgi:hypothetical protein
VIWLLSSAMWYLGMPLEWEVFNTKNSIELESSKYSTWRRPPGFSSSKSALFYLAYCKLKEICLMGPQTLPGSLLGQQKPQISYWDPINGICPHSWFCSCDGSSKTKCSFLSNNCCLCSGRLSFIVASIKASGVELLLQSDCLGAVLGLLDFIQMPTTETHRCRM